MEIKRFCKNQREVAQIINNVIDSYWNEGTTEKEMILAIQKLYDNNMEKIKKDGEYTKVLQQQCGKKRLDIISKILNSN